MIKIDICESCYSGFSGISLEEIKLQREKYKGKYICKTCELLTYEIINTPYNKVFIKDTKQLLIAKNGIYYYNNKKDRILSTNETGFLGHGGAWFLIETCDELFITNNLFKYTSLHPILINQIPEDKFHIVNMKLLNAKEKKEIEDSNLLLQTLSLYI